MQITRSYKPLKAERILFFFFLNFCLLIVMAGGIHYLFLRPPSMPVSLPRAITSDAADPENTVVVITGENVCYVSGKVFTFSELRKFLSASAHPGKILIKADRRASFGRIVDVMDLARSLGAEKINVATDREE